MKEPTLVYPEFLAMHDPVGKTAVKLVFKKQDNIQASGLAAPADPGDMQKISIFRKKVEAHACDALFLARLYATAEGQDLSGFLSLHLDGAGILNGKIEEFRPPEGSINCQDPVSWYRPMLTFPAIAVEGNRANVSKQVGWIVPHGCEIEVFLHRYMPTHPIKLEIAILGAIYTTQGVNNNQKLEIWNGKEVA